MRVSLRLAALATAITLLAACTPFTKIQGDEKSQTRIEGSWTVMHDGKTKIEGLNPPARIVFDAGSDKLSGFDGCNNFSGRYTFQNSEIKARLISTRMACRGATERAVSETLHQLFEQGAEVVAIDFMSAKAIVLRNKAIGAELRLGATEQLNEK